MFNRLKITASAFMFFGLVFALAPFASAQCVESPDDPLGLRCAANTGLAPTDPRFVVARIINISLGLLGTIAVALIVYAGFRWMTSGGNDEQVKGAQKTLFAAVVGLIIILSAFAISSFVLKNLYTATQAVPYGGVVD